MFDTGLFPDLAGDRFLKGLSGFNEPGDDAVKAGGNRGDRARRIVSPLRTRTMIAGEMRG